MALNVSPLYKHLYEIIRSKNVDSNARATKPSATSISNKNINREAKKSGYESTQNMAQHKFDQNKDHNQQHYREVKERLKKLDIL